MGDDENKNKKVSEGKLLYDPMFDKKVSMDWTDSEKGGIFGKAAVKKTVFIFVLLVSIGGSLFFSFSSLSKAKFNYDELTDGTYKLSAFNGQKNDYVLSIDFVRDEENMPDTDKPVTSVREYTVPGNDSLYFMFIGKDVKEIEKTAVFYCTALSAVFVDSENENFASIDGILYKKENGVLTEVLLCPQQHAKYMLALMLGESEPANAEEAYKLAAKLDDEKYSSQLWDMLDEDKYAACKRVELPDSIVTIGQLSFSYCDKLEYVNIPYGVKEIGTMAFFKCTSLKSVDLPDGLKTIGSDAFSKCSTLDYMFIPSSVKVIGHHAFFDCGKIEKIYMGAPDTNGMELGEKWLPQYRKTFMKNRDVVFNAQRGVR